MMGFAARIIADLLGSLGAGLAGAIQKWRERRQLAGLLAANRRLILRQIKQRRGEEEARLRRLLENTLSKIPEGDTDSHRGLGEDILNRRPRG